MKREYKDHEEWENTSPLVFIMSPDLLFGFIHTLMGCASIFLLETVKKFILSKPVGRRLVTADISIVLATTGQVGDPETKCGSSVDRRTFPNRN